MSSNPSPDPAPTGKIREQGWNREPLPLFHSTSIEQGNLVMTLKEQTAAEILGLAGVSYTGQTVDKATFGDVPWGIIKRSTRNPYDRNDNWGVLPGSSEHVITTDVFYDGDASLVLAEGHADIKAGDRIGVASERWKLIASPFTIVTTTPANLASYTVIDVKGKVDKFQERIIDSTSTATIKTSINKKFEHDRTVVGYATQDVASTATGNIPVHLTIRSMN